MKIFAASHVVPISSEAITDGAVAVEGTKIAAVGKREDLEARFSDAEIEIFENAAILPGLVNCHSHLEITAMRGALDSVEHDFRSWLLKLNELRSEMSDEDITAAAVAGAIEGAKGGVTCFGDIGRSGSAGLNALKHVGLRGIVFQETEFSPDDRTADDDFLKLAQKFETLCERADDLVSVGLSPHSPYTVSSRLLELIAQYSIINRIPISIHAAESACEMNLLLNGEGFFVDLYEKYSLIWNSPHSTPIEYLDRLGVLSARPLLAHCVTVNDTDIARIARNGATVAHCPKSNAKFGHGYAPLERMLDAGVPVGLGSDSVASNNICDLFEESRFAAFAARNRPDRRRFISARDALEIATIGGARALGLADKIGTIEAGKEADLAIISLGSEKQLPVNDIYAALVFSTSASDVMVTFVAGSEIYRR